MPDATGKLIPGDIGYVPPGAGLINTTPGAITTTPGQPVTGYTPATATATVPTGTAYNPTAFSVTPNQTVQEQVKQIIGADSPLMQQAATRAAMKMNERGLLNSSIAVGAGQEAVIGAALPIASADAAAYERAATNTVNAQNAAAAFKAQTEAQAGLTGAQLQSNIAQSNVLQINTALGKAADAALQIELQKIDTNTRMELGKLDAQNRQLLQSSASAAGMFQETVKNIAAIAVSNTMSQEAKDAATASQISALNEGLKTAAGIASTEQAAVTSLNLSQYFQPGVVAPTAAPAPPPWYTTPPAWAPPATPTYGYGYGQYGGR